MPSFSKIFSKPWLRGLLLGGLVFWLLSPLSFLPLGHFLENRALDFCYQWRPGVSSPPEILIVGIDEASFQELRRAWPWPRSWHARLLQRLAEAGAQVVVFDVVFADPTQEEEDRELIKAVRETGAVVLAQTLESVEDPKFRRQILVTPFSPLAAAARGVGLALVTPDADGVVRRFHASLAGQETLALVAARLFRPDLHLSASQGGLIDFAGPGRSLETVSYYQVIDPERPLPAHKVRGKMVLIGRTLEAGVDPRGQADAFPTPHYSLTGQTMAGVELQGHIIHTLLQGSSGSTCSDGVRIALFLIIFLAVGYLFARLTPLTGLIALLCLWIILFGTTVYLFFVHRFWFPPVLLGAGVFLVYGGNSLGHYFLVAKDRRWLRQAFSRYVSQSLVEMIISHPEELRLGGKEVEVTVLFSDLAGFTAISENLSPESLIHLLNEYFSTMTDIILTCRGTVDKFIGDAIMAFWGAPLPARDHALTACKAALAMQEALRPLQTAWQERGLPLLMARLGFHTGPAIVGNVGSRDRFNYTVMGDTVNLASRLEGVNKVYGTTILASETTYQQAADAFLFREVDQVRVKGRQQPVTIYELLGRREDQGRFPWLETFAAALRSYRQQQWDQASDLFREVLAQRPGDPPSLCFQRRLEHYQHHPPSPEWCGVYSLDSK
ncbi:MAG: adenylate/guanylate cyclase domain-containing protein [Deltaproteobacteria bacterium]|nr:adenylate/guanylate cyclase domain-containing protein [Deltaproteobacteria bacterium]